MNGRKRKKEQSSIDFFKGKLMISCFIGILASVKEVEQFCENI
jgi:hypothetical protein